MRNALAIILCLNNDTLSEVCSPFYSDFQIGPLILVSVAKHISTFQALTNLVELRCIQIEATIEFSFICGLTGLNNAVAFPAQDRLRNEANRLEAL